MWGLYIRHVGYSIPAVNQCGVAGVWLGGLYSTLVMLVYSQHIFVG
jgi:hypothetical protein